MAKKDEVILDFSEVRPFEPLDPGPLYLCRVRALDVSMAASGQKKSHCELEVLAPEEVQVENWEQNDEAPGGMVSVGMSERKTKAAGRIFFREFSLQPQALPFLYQFIKALDPDAELNEAFVYKPEEYIGLECTVKMHNEAFQEQIRPRVDRIYPASRHWS